MENHVLANIIVTLPIVILIFVYLLFYQKKRDGFITFIRSIMVPFLLIGGFSVYFFGYQYQRSLYDVIPNFFHTIFSTGGLFILDGDLTEVRISIKETPVFHAWFSLMSFSAVFVFASFVLHIFLKDRLVRFRIRKMRPAEVHVFFGINEATLSLAVDLQKNNAKRLVVFVKDMCERDVQPLYTSAVDAGILVIKRKSLLESINLEKEEGISNIRGTENESCLTLEDEKIFKNLKLLVSKIKCYNSHLYFLMDDEDWNLLKCNQVVSELKEFSFKEKVKIHIRINNETTYKQFYEWSKIASQGIGISLHNHAIITARQLIYHHNPVDSVSVDAQKALATSDFNAMIIGFGQIGFQVLRKLVEHGQFVDCGFQATVIDKSVNTLQGRFQHLYPGIIENYDLSFVNSEVGHSDFYSEIKKRINSLNYIVIALGNDKLNMQTATDILDMFSDNCSKQFKILVHVTNNAFYSNLPKQILTKISIFGRDNEVYSEKIIVQGEQEYRGRKIHDIYCAQFGDNKSFDEIGYFEQLSNISAAEHLYNKMKLIGIKTEDDVWSYGSSKAFMDSLSDVQKLNLAKSEHLRWNAFHFCNGWTLMKKADFPLNTMYKDRKNIQKHKHACLVDWDSLKELGNIFGGNDLQELDKKTIDSMYDFISAK